MTITSAQAGSSPHTRGALGDTPAEDVDARIIPAYAGSTCTITKSSAVAEDHPRIRGEHSTLLIRGTRSSGSSPHTRGARELRRHLLFDAGIIPAYAGSTWTNLTGSGRLRDHPRIRGEHPVHGAARDRRAGSSPHTRGAPSALLRHGFCNRIIPAYAGSTCCYPS